MNNTTTPTISWDALGIDAARAEQVNWELNNRMGGDGWRYHAELVRWFPTAKADARPIHEVILAAKFGLLTKSELDRIKDAADEQAPEPEPEPEPEEEQGEEPQDGDEQDGDPGADGGQQGDPTEGQDGEPQDGEPGPQGGEGQPGDSDYSDGGTEAGENEGEGTDPNAGSQGADERDGGEPTEGEHGAEETAPEDADAGDGEGNGEGQDGDGEQGDEGQGSEGSGDAEGEGEGSEQGDGDGGDSGDTGEGDGDGGEGTSQGMGNDGEPSDEDGGELGATGEGDEGGEQDNAAEAGIGEGGGQRGHADEAQELQALQSLLGGNGGGNPPQWFPRDETEQAASDEAFGYWRTGLARLVSSIRRTFQSIARTRVKRHKRTGKLDLGTVARISADSQFVFQQKLKGTNRRVAVATVLDYSGSMNSGSIDGLAGVEGLRKTFLRYGLTKQAQHVADYIAASRKGYEAWKAQFIASGRTVPEGYDVSNGLRIVVDFDAITHAMGYSAGFNRRTGFTRDKLPSHAKVTFYMEGQWTGYQSEVTCQQQCSVTVATDGQELTQKIAALFHRLHGQWIGCNLIRSAFRKSGIAQWWGCFTGEPHTLRDWNETHGTIPAPTRLGNSTNVCAGVGTLLNVLSKRKEERRIAVVFSDGSFSNNSARIESNPLASDSRGRNTTTQKEIKRAWSKGIEVYYIGLQVGEAAIKQAEHLLGPDHAVNVTDIATELPAVLESIIRMDERDLRQTAKGQGFAIKRR